MQRLQATGMVDECPRSGKPRKSTPREDTLIARCARRNRFSTSDRNRDELNFWGRVSIRTVNRRLKGHYLRAKELIQRPQLPLVIDGLDGIGHVIIVIGNKSIGQTKVNFYCVPWMAAFGSGGIETLHVMTGT